MKSDFSEMNSNNSDREESLNNSFMKEIKYMMEYIITENNNNKKHKISLYEIRGFDPYLIFNEIDSISSGYINQSDLNEYLSNNNIKSDKDIILLFIREYNKKENDNNLNSQDFVKFMSFDINKNAVNLGTLDFDKNEIKKHFLSLILSEFELIKEKNELIKQIIRNRKFSTFEAFYNISNDNKYIDFNCLKLFLGEKYNDNEIKELLYRIDLNDDKKISYDEFQDMFFPFQKHLLFEETNEDEKYDYGIESYNDILINYCDIYNIDINPYKDNSLTEPKIVCNFNEFEDEDENDNYKLEIENKYFINKINNNDIDEQNPFKNDINIDVYKSEDFKIKYDENLINEISRKNNDDNKEINEVNDDDKNLNVNTDNNKKDDNKENKKFKKEENNYDIHGSMIFFDDN
jgi:hypothetical protein